MNDDERDESKGSHDEPGGGDPAAPEHKRLKLVRESIRTTAGIRGRETCCTTSPHSHSFLA